MTFGTAVADAVGIQLDPHHLGTEAIEADLHMIDI